MPSKPRPGVRPIYVELPEDVANRLELLAEKNARKIKAEMVLAIEAHLAANEETPPPGRPRKAPAEADDKPAKKGKGKRT